MLRRARAAQRNGRETGFVRERTRPAGAGRAVASIVVDLAIASLPMMLLVPWGWRAAGGVFAVSLACLAVAVVFVCRTGRALGGLVTGTRLISAETGSALGAVPASALLIDVRHGPDPLRRLLAPAPARPRRTPPPLGVPSGPRSGRRAADPAQPTASPDRVPSPSPSPSTASSPEVAAEPRGTGRRAAAHGELPGPGTPEPHAPVPRAPGSHALGSNVTVPVEPVRWPHTLAPHVGGPARTVAPWPGSTRTGAGNSRLRLDGGSTFRLSGGAVAGRSPVVRDAETAIPIPDLARRLSRSHVRFDLDAAGRLLVTDLGSLNGTYLRGAGSSTLQRLPSDRPVLVPADAEIVVSGHVLTLEAAGGDA